MSVPARISLVTLGVSDLDRSRAFYDALGWERVGDAEGVVFFRTGGAILSLFPLEALAQDAHLSADPDGYAWELAYNPHWPLDADGLPQLL